MRMVSYDSRRPCQPIIVPSHTKDDLRAEREALRQEGRTRGSYIRFLIQKSKEMACSTHLPL